MHMMTPCGNPIFFEDDDKYAKLACSQKQMPVPLQKYHEATLTIFNLLPSALVTNSSFLFGCVYFFIGFIYVHFGGHPGEAPWRFFNVASISVEVFGLLVLRHKINSRKSVNGISAMTMLMYAACYAVRIWLNFPGVEHLNFMVMKVEASFGVVSLLLVLDCLRLIFVTHHGSYQADLDVLHVKYLLPVCFLLACFLHVQFHDWSPFYAYIWSSCLYMDVLALMPQVVMMARGGGKVEAPIAHFVAATFLSRIEDLSDTFMFESFHDGENFSFWLVTFFQGLHLLLVADFMYHYVKARISRKKFDNTMIEI